VQLFSYKVSDTFRAVSFQRQLFLTTIPQK